MPAGAARGILSGMYLLQTGGKGKLRVTLFGSGTILREVLAAAAILEKDYGVPADVYSVTSFSELRRDALSIARWNMLHPNEPQQQNYVQQTLAGCEGPFIAVHRARHRWLRTQRLARRTAPFLRGGPPLRRGRLAQGAGR
jgi:pyruvate dehydrogenase E1 component